MVLQLLPVGGTFAQKLCKTIRAFAEARDIKVDIISTSCLNDACLAAELVPIATIIVLDESATSSQLDDIHFTKDWSYALFGFKQSQFIDILKTNANQNQAIHLLPPHNTIGGPESFEIWMSALWDALSAKGVKFQFPKVYEVDILTHHASDDATTTLAHDISIPQGYRKIPVVDNKLLTSEDYPRPSHMLTLDISNTGFKYNLGDHVTILPRNSAEAVENAGKVLGLDLDQIITVRSIKDSTTTSTTPTTPTTSIRIPTGIPIRIKDVLTYYLDIQGLASRRFIAALSLIASEPRERDALHELATRMNADSPYRHKLRSVFTNIDAIQQHPSVRLSIDDVLSLLPPLNPRMYSASSSPLKNPNTVQCTFVVLHYPTQDQTIFRGLSTNFLRALQSGDSVAMTLRRGFKEVEVDTPGIKYVGCALGSGIALLRGIVQHFYYSTKQSSSTTPSSTPVMSKESMTGRMLLYYGVRHEAKDFIFKDELREYQNAGVLKMHESFSHDQEQFITPATKIRESMGELVEYLVDDPKCKFIYCGPAGPAYESVEQAIKDAIKAERPLVDAEQHLRLMRSQARWEVQAFSPTQDPENPFIL